MLHSGLPKNVIPLCEVQSESKTNASVYFNSILPKHQEGLAVTPKNLNSRVIISK